MHLTCLVVNVAELCNDERMEMESTEDDAFFKQRGTALPLNANH